MFAKDVNCKCCLGCEKRHVKCHVDCPEYLAFRQEKDKATETMIKESLGTKYRKTHYYDKVRKKWRKV